MLFRLFGVMTWFLFVQGVCEAGCCVDTTPGEPERGPTDVGVPTVLLEGRSDKSRTAE